MLSLFSHRGPEFVPSDGPSAFAQRYSEYQMGKRKDLWPSPEHPKSLHLRGSLSKQGSASGRRPTSAPPSVAGDREREAPSNTQRVEPPPAAQAPERPHILFPTPETQMPVHVTLKEVMDDVTAHFDMNVSEYDHIG